MTKFSVRNVISIQDIAAADWDRCANPLRTDQPAQPGGERFNPFISHGFLSALETSGSVGGKTGWHPVHVVVEGAGGGPIVACAPAYLKTHSLGEYVFDQSIAEAFARIGGEYYPKLQIAAPFSPVPGRRLLVAADAPEGAREALLLGLRALREGNKASSVHVTFPDESDWKALGEAGFLLRKGQQFHFSNRGYTTFDDFLASLASRKRKMIRKEREQALAPGIEIEWATGAELTEAHWDAFYAFYVDTSARKWGRPYLNRAFFTALSEALSERILLVLAKREGRYIAGALNLIGDDALYGRNWGAIEEHPCLHFELCYYQAIDFAIQRGLSRVEAGAQGEHKLARGYEPVPTYSAHEFADPRLSVAADDFFRREAGAVDKWIEAYAEHTPFKKG